MCDSLRRCFSSLQMINPVSCLPPCSFKLFLHHMSSYSHNTEIHPCGVLMMEVMSEISCHYSDPLCPVWKLYSYNDMNELLCIYCIWVSLGHIFQVFCSILSDFTVTAFVILRTLCVIVWCCCFFFFCFILCVQHHHLLLFCEDLCMIIVQGVFCGGYRCIVTVISSIVLDCS